MNGKYIKSKIIFSEFLFICVFVFTSCMTMADIDFTPIDSKISAGHYAEAAVEVDKGKGHYYSSKEKVIQYLDAGMLNHYAGDFKLSNENLSLAEKEIDKNFTKSITQGIGKALVNDNVANYPGEVFEDLYSNIFMCLNYIHMNNTEDAMVEIRRFDNKMKVAGSKYQDIIDQHKAQLSSEYQYKDFNPGSYEIEFHNSAFARYLSMLLYRTEGDYDAARIDYNKINDAFTYQKNVYNFSIPKTIEEELKVTKKDARINAVCFAGKSPVKVEKTMRIAFSGSYYKLALPEMVNRPTEVDAIQIVMKNVDDGTEYKMNLNTIERIDNIAQDTYKQHYGSIVARTIMRSIGKSVRSGIFREVSRNADDSGTSALFGMLNIFSQISTEFSERADVRVSRYFPSIVSVAGLTVPPGKYDIAVNYYSKGRTIIYTERIDEFPVKAGELNLIESICQK